jgi:hypothetical protein
MLSEYDVGEKLDRHTFRSKIYDLGEKLDKHSFRLKI